MRRSLTLDVLVTAAERTRALARDVREGMTRPTRSLPPVWFYDDAGGRLFDEITRLPEYYLTRAEQGILASRAVEVVARTKADVLVEIGSGTSAKTRLLLDAMRDAGSLRQVVLLDISEDVLTRTAATLSRDYDVDVHAVVGDFRHHLDALPGGDRRLWAFLGSTIGNLALIERHELLSHIGRMMADDDHILLGTDLLKDPARLVAAYDDAAGVTAAFNRNLLHVLNRELAGDFELPRFEHRALWNARSGWVEMRLRARLAHDVHLERLGLTVAFEAGDEILTETCAKFHPDQVAAELAAAGLLTDVAWLDPAEDFQVTLARRSTEPGGLAAAASSPLASLAARGTPPAAPRAPATGDDGEGLFDADEARLRARRGIKWRRYGATVLPAWVADMDFPVVPAVRDAIAAMVARGDLGYPDWRSGSPLRRAFAARMADRYGWAADPDRVREVTDIIQGVQLSLHLATAPGDAVALHTPAYPPFLASIQAMGRRLVPIPMDDTDEGWRFDAERAEEAVAASGCRALIVVNPHNPTGRVFSRDELSSLADIADRHDLVVLADEVHAELTFRPHVHVPFASLSPSAAGRTITLTSATKAFNLAGIRCAVAHVGPERVLGAADAEPSHLYGQPSVLSVEATLAAWRHGGPWLEGLMSRLEANRRLVADTLATRLPSARHHPPEGTYLAWIDLRPLGLGPEPAARLLERGRIAVNRGLDFGEDAAGFVRVNFATSSAVLTEVLDRLVAAAGGS